MLWNNTIEKTLMHMDTEYYRYDLIHGSIYFVTMEDQKFDVSINEEGQILIWKLLDLNLPNRWRGHQWIRYDSIDMNRIFSLQVSEEGELKVSMAIHHTTDEKNIEDNLENHIKQFLLMFS